MKQTFVLALSSFAFLLHANAVSTNIHTHGIYGDLMRNFRGYAGTLRPHLEMLDPRNNEVYKQLECTGNHCYCDSVYDLTLVLEESKYITPAQWGNSVLPFAQNVVKNLNVSPDRVHVGIMSFSANIRDFIKFGDPESSDKEKLLEKVEGLGNFYQQQHGSTARLIESMQHAFKNYTKDPNSRPDVSKVTILFTHGKDSFGADSQLSNISSIYKKTNTKLIVVGAGDVDAMNFMSIGGCAVGTEDFDGNCPNVLKPEWEDLPNIAGLVTDKIYDINTEVETRGGTRECPTQYTVTRRGIDAICNEWAEWEACSSPCGLSEKTRTRQTPLELVPAQEDNNGEMGLSCLEQDIAMKEAAPCDVPACDHSLYSVEHTPQDNKENKKSATSRTAVHLSLCFTILGLALLV